MKKTTFFTRHVQLLGVVAATVWVSACGSLQDVNHKWCPPEQKVAPAPMQERITLKADALFRFNKSGINDMLPQGKAELDDLAQKLINGYVQIDKLTLIGHTDRLGSEAYNQRLSEARAVTVAQYLSNKGVNASMQAIGKGKSEPSGQTNHCVGHRATPQLTECLQPDRRVDVLIEGLKK